MLKNCIYDRVYDGRISAIGARALCILEDGTEKLINDIYLETQATICEYEDAACVEWLHNTICYDYEYDDIDYFSCDDYDVKEVKEVVDADWQIDDIYWFNDCKDDIRDYA